MSPLPVTVLMLAILLAPSVSNASPGSRERPLRVSLVQVLANPDTLVGQRIQVVGVLALGFEGDALCLTFEHATEVGGACAGLAFESLSRDGTGMEEWVRLGERNRTYVIVEGTVALTKGIQRIRIVEVTRVAAVPLDPDFEWRPQVPAQPGSSQLAEPNRDSAEIVPMLRLLAAPETFEGRLVQTIGVLSLYPKGSERLCLSREHAMDGKAPRNCATLRFSTQEVQELEALRCSHLSYVSLSGIVKAELGRPETTFGLEAAHVFFWPGTSPCVQAVRGGNDDE